MADTITIAEFQDHCEKQTSDFRTLEKLANDNKDDNKIVHREIKDIKNTLESWTPFIKSYKTEMERANAYKIVAEDLKSKGVGWKFWLGLVIAVLTLMSLVFVLIDKFK